MGEEEEWSCWGLVLVGTGVGAVLGLEMVLGLLMWRRRSRLEEFWGSSGQDQFRWDWKRERKRREMKRKSRTLVREETRRRRVVKQDLRRLDAEEAAERMRRARAPSGLASRLLAALRQRLASSAPALPAGRRGSQLAASSLSQLPSRLSEREGVLSEPLHRLYRGTSALEEQYNELIGRLPPPHPVLGPLHHHIRYRSPRKTNSAPNAP